MTVPPTEYYFAKVTLSGGSTMTLDTGGQHVDIVVEGKFVGSGSKIRISSVRSLTTRLQYNSTLVTDHPVASGGSTELRILLHPRHLPRIPNWYGNSTIGDGNCWLLLSPTQPTGLSGPAPRVASCSSRTSAAPGPPRPPPTFPWSRWGFRRTWPWRRCFWRAGSTTPAPWPSGASAP